MTNAAPILGVDTLHAAFGKVAIVGVLVGDYSGVAALRLARVVFETHPALFPWFAGEIVASGARAAAWSLAQVAADLVGGWEIYAAARDIAHSA